jgi:hypothetical protein
MSDKASLVVEKMESWMLANMPRARPDTVYVLSYQRGDVRAFVRPPGISERAGSRYCFVVDVAQQHTSGKVRIPASGDVYFFGVEFEAVWHVSDPTTIVRHNITDGGTLITGHLRDLMWRSGRHYGPTDAEGAEEAIRRALRPPVVIDSGLTVTALSVRLTLDERRSDATAELDASDHAGLLAQRRVRLLQGLLDGDEAYLMLHLAQHPDDTGTILQMLAAARDRSDQVRLGLLDKMIDNGFILDADIGPLRDSILGVRPTPALPSASATMRPAPPVISAPPTAHVPHAAVHPAAPTGSAPYVVEPDARSPSGLTAAPSAAEPQDRATSATPDRAPSADTTVDEGSDNVVGWRRVNRGRRGGGV